MLCLVHPRHRRAPRRVGARRHDGPVPRRAARQRGRGRRGRDQPDPLADHRVRALGRARRRRRWACSRCVSRPRATTRSSSRSSDCVGGHRRLARLPHGRRRDPGRGRLHLLPAGRARGLDPVDLQPRARAGRARRHGRHRARARARPLRCLRRDRGDRRRVVLRLLPRRRTRLDDRLGTHRARDRVLRHRRHHLRQAPRGRPRAQQAQVARADAASGSTS